MVYWSKLVVFAAICSLIWVAFFGTILVFGSPMAVLLFDNPRDIAFAESLRNSPSLGASVVSEAAGRSQTIDLAGGNLAVAGLGGCQVVIIALLILWVAVTFRGSGPWAWGILGAVFFLCVFGPIIPLFFHIDSILTSRQQLVFYANHSGMCWLVLSALAGVVIWDTRRRYVRSI